MKKVVVSIVGAALILLGLALMPLPGPGFLVVVAGLGVLATQYEWARQLMGGAKDKAWTAQKEAVETPVRLAVTVAGALTTISVGALMIAVRDVAWPFWSSVFDAVWSPWTGGGLILGGLVVLGTTFYAWRKTHDGSSGGGGARARHGDRGPGMAGRRPG